MKKRTIKVNFRYLLERLRQQICSHFNIIFIAYSTTCFILISLIIFLFLYLSQILSTVFEYSYVIHSTLLSFWAYFTCLSVVLASGSMVFLSLPSRCLRVLFHALSWWYLFCLLVYFKHVTLLGASNSLA